MTSISISSKPLDNFVCSAEELRDIKDDTLHSLKKLWILSKNVIFHE